MITSADEFIYLRYSPNPDEYYRASWEDAPEYVWLELIEINSAIREQVAHNKSIPDSIIRILAADSEPRVRHRIAMKRKTPPDVLEVLARDSDESVRHAVALNQKTPVHILGTLLNDEWINVVESAKNRLAEIENKRQKKSGKT